MPLTASVEDVIQAAVAEHKDTDRKPVLETYHPRCFELRLHEADGYPDEDVPGDA